MSHVNLLKSVLLLFIASITFSCKVNEKKAVKAQPLNVLWINADDLGRELSCYGNPDVKTPNMDHLAKQGVRYTNAYSNAPVCSSSRSSQITGMYPSAINVLDHRTINMKQLPEGITTVMDIFRKNGYFCTNGWAHNMKKAGKEDYNFLGENLFDGTDWNQRADGQPFFAQVQIHEPHRIFVDDKERPINPDEVTLPGCYPDHPLIRADWAKYLESVQIADKQVGQILERLENEGLADNTVVILFGDHGRPHVRDKQWLYEGGLAIPLIVRYPKNKNAGTLKKDLISLVDVTASSLKLVGIEIPNYMHGKDVLNNEKREYVFGFRQRCGDAVDDIRSITDGTHKLIWNRMPELPYMQLTSYKKLQYPAYALYHYLHEKNELKAPYNQFMAETRPEIELYDLKNDPDEFNNLAEVTEYQKTKNRLFDILKNNIADFEKNRILEDAETIKKAKESSKKYYIEALSKQKPGLSPNASYETIVKDWEQRLLVN